MSDRSNPHSHPQQRRAIEDAIVEIAEVLRAAAPSPAVRELRVRHGALARVVHGWDHPGPHASQLGAMQECVLELRAAVLKACPARPREVAVQSARPPARPTARTAPAKHMKTTRPPPRRATAGHTTRPPPRKAGPPSSRRG